MPAAVEEEIDRASQALAAIGRAVDHPAADDAERAELWAVRRQLSLALRATGLLKINHDVVVPRGRVPELFEEVARLKAALRAAGGLLRPRRRRQHPRQLHDRSGGRGGARARAGARSVSSSRGSSRSKGPSAASTASASRRRRISTLELSADEIALMRRVKQAFDPAGILNPGKIFPD